MPLSDASTRVLCRVLELPRSQGVIFPNPCSPDGVIPDATIRRMVQRARMAASPHDFRWTFRTWAQEREQPPGSGQRL